MFKRTRTVLRILLAIGLFTIGFTAVRIYTFRNNTTTANADAAIVLGAAVWSDQVSPVFRERINHAMDLHRTGRVRKIIFTGGQGNPQEPTEAVAARTYAIENGIPAGDILIEQQSHTTYENIANAKIVANRAGLKTLLIVSDPMHMKRALAMAKDLDMDAYPSPTPTTRYITWRSQWQELARETVYYLGYQATSVL